MSAFEPPRDRDAYPVIRGFRYQVDQTILRWLDLGGTEGDAGLKSFKIGNVGKRGRVVELAGEYDFSDSALSRIASLAMTSTRNLMQGRPVHLSMPILGHKRA